MVEMYDRQHDSEFVSDFKQRTQKCYGVSAARNGDSDTIPRLEQVGIDPAEHGLILLELLPGPHTAHGLRLLNPKSSVVNRKCLSRLFPGPLWQMLYFAPFVPGTVIHFRVVA